jgi:tetratricopeptide (TPR) repeat protein
MTDVSQDITQGETVQLRAELEELRDWFRRHRSAVEKENESNKIWLAVQRDSWFFVAMGAIAILLIGGGLMGGVYWPALHQRSDLDSIQALTPQAFDPQFQQVLTAFIPGLMLVLTIFVGFVGLKRLQVYDTAISDARKEQRDEQNKFEASVAGTVKTQAENEVRQALGAENARRLSAIEELNEKIDARKSEIEQALSEYAWLKHASEEQRNALRDGQVSSAGQANKIVEEFFEAKNAPAAIAIVQLAINNDNISGTPDDWFNMSAELGRNDQEQHALKVCQRGLKQAPNNIDLLSHALQYAYKIGNWDEAKKYYRSLVDLGMDKWNWRCFVFASDYLIERGDADDETRKLLKRFEENIPSDERAHTQMASIYLKLGRADKVVEICERGMKLVNRRAGLGLILADALIALGRYDEALQACDDALIGTAELQPTADISSIMWRRGAAYDAKAIAALRGSGPNRISEAQVFSRQAVANYKTAVEMPGAVSRMGGRQAVMRIAVLQSLA